MPERAGRTMIAAEHRNRERQDETGSVKTSKCDSPWRPSQERRTMRGARRYRRYEGGRSDVRRFKGKDLSSSRVGYRGRGK